MNEQHDRHKVPDVQAVCRGVKAHIRLDTLLGHQVLGAWHDVVQQASPFQFFNQRHGRKDNVCYK